MHSTDAKRFSDWANRISRWFEKGTEEIYFYVNNRDEAHSPEMCVYVIDKINAVCKLDLKKPRFIEG